MAGFIQQEQWKTFLDDFSKRNQLRSTRLEVVGNEIGALPEEDYLPLMGVSFEPKGSDAGSVLILLGDETSRSRRHVEHVVERVERIAPFTGMAGVEDGLGFEDREGNKTLLIFDQLREIPENASEGQERTSTRT